MPELSTSLHTFCAEKSRRGEKRRGDGQIPLWRMRESVDWQILASSTESTGSANPTIHHLHHGWVVVGEVEDFIANCARSSCLCSLALAAREANPRILHIRTRFSIIHLHHPQTFTPCGPRDRPFSAFSGSSSIVLASLLCSSLIIYHIT